MIPNILCSACPPFINLVAFSANRASNGPAVGSNNNEEAKPREAEGTSWEGPSVARLQNAMSEEWTPLRISALIALWNEGLSTSEIGNRLGITKNAVVGKVHRLGLPKRYTPVAKKVESSSVVRLESLKAGMCSWPDGEPGTDEFRFCGHPAIEGKPYCAEHCARAYVRVTKERKDAAA